MGTDLSHMTHPNPPCSPQADVRFYQSQYARYFHRDAYRLREDFCGTGHVALLWCCTSEAHSAAAVDLSQEAIAWGQHHINAHTLGACATDCTMALCNQW